MMSIKFLFLLLILIPLSSATTSTINQNGSYTVVNTTVSSNSIVSDVLNVTNYMGLVVGSYVDGYSCSASYCIYHPWYNPSLTNAKNGSTGRIDFSGTNVSIIVNQATNLMTNGGTLYIKSGIYALNGSSITILYNNTNVVGDGLSTILTMASNSNVATIQLGTGTPTISNTVSLNNITISNLQINGNKSTQSGVFPNGEGISSWGSTTYKISSVLISNVYIHHVMYHGIYHQYGSNWIVTDSIFDNNGDSAIELGYGKYFSVNNNIDYRSKYGVVINGDGSEGSADSSFYNNVENNIFSSNGLDQSEGDGIHFYNFVFDSIISGNNIYSTRDHGISILDGMKRIIISNNRIDRGAQGATNTYGGIFIRNQYTQSVDNFITGNFIRGDRYKYGIWSQSGGNRTYITNNIILDAPISICSNESFGVINNNLGGTTFNISNGC